MHKWLTWNDLHVQPSGSKPVAPLFVLQVNKMVATLGFEPRQADSESTVLPLHNAAIKWWWMKVLHLPSPKAARLQRAPLLSTV